MASSVPWYSPQRLLRSAYSRRLRPLLPKADPIRYAGVVGPRDRRVGDRWFAGLVKPHLREDQPGYEAALVSGLRQHLHPGDRVVVVGGGLGITAALSALLVGPSGFVTCYEGDNTAIADILLTAQRNGVAGRLEIQNAIVGKSIGVYGGNHSLARVAPEELPECDLLELDCEGSETGILSGMRIRPRAVIVETHGIFGAPTAATHALLTDLGYNVTDMGWAEPRLVEACIAHDIRVLTGVRKD